MMTSTDPVAIFAGFALDDAVTDQAIRFRRSGADETAHMLMAGSPKF